MDLIKLDNMVKTYHLGEVDVPGLRGVSLSIEHGDMVALMGPSGSGKTTLMNLLGCLDRPTSGIYKLDGVDVSKLDANERAEIRNSKIGFVFQSFNLLARTSGLENVELPLLYGSGALGPRERMVRARRVLSLVGLEGREHHYPSQLSGGQQQRVAIARALITDPAILLADEPTGNLDSRTSEEILVTIQHLNDQGKTVLLITHEHDVAVHAKRVVHMRDGRIVSDEPVAQVRATRTEVKA